MKRALRNQLLWSKLPRIAAWTAPRITCACPGAPAGRDGRWHPARATGITSAISTDLNPRVLVSFLTVRQQRCQHRRTATAIPANVDRGLAIDRVVPTSTISSGPRRVSLSEDRVSKCQRRRTWHEPLTQVDPPIGDVVSGPGIHAGLEPSQPCGRATL